MEGRAGENGGAVKRLRRLTAALLAAVGLLYVTVSATPLVLWWARALAGSWSDPQGDMLVVLGNDDPNFGVIGAGSYWRSAYAVLAWRRGGFRAMVVSGTGAESMKTFVVAHGIPAAAVLVESRSATTRENALFTRELLASVPPGRRVLLTSDYHMFRALRTFRRAGVEVHPWPVPDALKRGSSWVQRPAVFAELVVETVKIAWYGARGWT